MVKQLVEVPETVSQKRIQQRTVEQIVDVPVPQVVEELMEVSHVFLQDRVRQRFVEQIIEAPAISLAEQIVEVPVIQMQGETQQGANTHVQHVVDTVEVEKPKITELTVHRKKPIIQEKMSQVTKPIEFPQAQFLNKVGDMLVGMQRHVLMAQTVRRAEDVGFSTCPAHRQSPEHSRDGTDTGPIRSESSEDRGDASGAVLGRTRHHTTSGAHDPERAEDCGGAADPVH